MRDYIVTVDESEEELMHYGVVGMKWHHRRATAYAAKGNMKKAQQHLDKNIANQKRMAKLGKIDPVSKATSKISKYNNVSQKDVNRYRTSKSLATKAGIAAGAGALVGYTGVKLVKNAAANKALRNRYMSPADRMRNSSVQPGVVMDNLRNSMGNNNRTTVNRSQTPKPNNNRRTVNNQNTRSGIDELQKALREYQDLSNRAGADLERRRNKIKQTTNRR